MKLLKLTLIISIIIAFAGCSSIQSYSVITTKEVDLQKKYAKKEPINQKHVRKIFVLFPVGPGFDGSITETLKSNNTEYLTDVTIRTNSWYIPLIYGQTTYDITAESWGIEN